MYGMYRATLHKYYLICMLINGFETNSEPDFEWEADVKREDFSAPRLEDDASVVV